MTRKQSNGWDEAELVETVAWQTGAEASAAYAHAVETVQAQAQPKQGEKLFDITCVIGSVHADPGGQFTPRQVAFLMIADYTADGAEFSEFHFPGGPGGADIVVGVTNPVEVAK